MYTNNSQNKIAKKKKILNDNDNEHENRQEEANYKTKQNFHFNSNNQTQVNRDTDLLKNNNFSNNIVNSYKKLFNCNDFNKNN